MHMMISCDNAQHLAKVPPPLPTPTQPPPPPKKKYIYIYIFVPTGLNQTQTKLGFCHFFKFGFHEVKPNEVWVISFPLTCIV